MAFVVRVFAWTGSVFLDKYTTSPLGLETFCRIAQPLDAASVSSSIQPENLETVQVEHEPFVAPEELEVPQDVEIVSNFTWQLSLTVLL